MEVIEIAETENKDYKKDLEARVKLVRVRVEEAEILWKMQVEAFSELYEKYQDTQTSPATEKKEKVEARLKQDFTYYYFIEVDGEKLGAIRVVDKREKGVNKRISPIFILKQYRGKGYAQEAIRQAEEIHGSEKWQLDTILQEKGNCYLYEKLGYKRTSKQEEINDKMTLVFYEK